MKAENKEIFMDAETLRESSTEELEGALRETKERLHTIRSDAAVIGSAKRLDCEKPHLMKGCRKLIARIETILREREG